MKLVSEQSTAEIEKHRALSEFRMHLRALAANILRVTRGAGHPHRLGVQMSDCLVALTAYEEAAGHGVPSEDVKAMLNPKATQAEHRPWIKEVRAARTGGQESEDECDREIALQDIRRACLQITASMLLDQPTIQTRARSDLYAGIRALNEVQEYQRARHAKGVKARPAPRQRKPEGKIVL